MIRHLAWASLRRHTTRTALAILGVAVAAAMLLDMVMMSTGLRESFRDLLLSRGYNLRLAPKGTLPFDTDATIDSASVIMSRLAANPEILKITPELGGTIHFPVDGKVVTSSVLGVNPETQGTYEIVTGHDPRADDEIVVNQDFLKASGTKVGDTIDVATGYNPQLHTYSGSRKLIISAKARFLYGSANQLASAVRLKTLQEMGGPSRADVASLFMIEVRDVSRVEIVSRDIERQFPSVSALSIATALAQVDERLSYFRQLAFMLGTVSLIVGFLLVTTLVTVSVNERIGEITVMRALGVSRAHVIQQIVLEGIVITLSGAILGLGLGLITARFLNSILSSFPGLPVAIDFFLFQPRAAWSALGMLSLSGIAAGIYPSWRAASLPIATTLREEAIA
jgi:putative ABC transport system permease protein